MRIFEVMFILKPDLPDEEIDRVISQMESVVTATGGKLQKTEKMGRRRLAYTMARQREGFYVLFVLECEAATVQELERRLKVAEPVMKHLTVRVDDELKRLHKLQRLRAKKTPPQRTRPAAEAAAPPAVEQRRVQTATGTPEAVPGREERNL